MAVDMDKLQEFLGRFVADLGATFAAGNVVIGHRLGLYRALAAGPAHAGELAERTGTSPRYIAEWLRGQAAGGYVEYDPATEAYSMTEEQAFALANPDGGVYVPGAFVLALGTLKAEPRITAAFRTGAGMGWHEHDEGVFLGCEQFFRPGYSANLIPSWIPALDGVAGAAGRRHGRRYRLRARRIHHPARPGIPELPVHRVGLSRPVDRDRPQAGRRRRCRRPGQVRGRAGGGLLRHRLRPGRDVRLPARHGRPGGRGPARPPGPQARRHLASRRAVRGRRGGRQPQPGRAVYYNASTQLCMPNALSQPGGYALGAQAGEAAIRQVVTDAGFTRFRRAAETPFNLVYEVRP